MKKKLKSKLRVSLKCNKKSWNMKNYINKNKTLKQRILHIWKTLKPQPINNRFIKVYIMKSSLKNNARKK